MNDYGEPWKPPQIGNTVRVDDATLIGRYGNIMDHARAIACVNALAGLDQATLAALQPGDVGKLVKLLRRFVALDDGDAPFCWDHSRLWDDGRALLARLPE